MISERAYKNSIMIQVNLCGRLSLSGHKNGNVLKDAYRTYILQSEKDIEKMLGPSEIFYLDDISLICDNNNNYQDIYCYKLSIPFSYLSSLKNMKEVVEETDIHLSEFLKNNRNQLMAVLHAGNLMFENIQYSTFPEGRIINDIDFCIEA